MSQRKTDQAYPATDSVYGIQSAIGAKLILFRHFIETLTLANGLKKQHKPHNTPNYSTAFGIGMQITCHLPGRVRNVYPQDNDRACEAKHVSRRVVRSNHIKRV